MRPCVVGGQAAATQAASRGRSLGRARTMLGALSASVFSRTAEDLSIEEDRYFDEKERRAHKRRRREQQAREEEQTRGSAP